MEQQQEVPEEQSCCDRKGHIKCNCRSTGNKEAGLARRTEKCSHCNKPGHQESECWKKDPEKTPDWLKKKTKDREIAGIAIDGETAFISVFATIPVETVQEDGDKNP